MSALIPEQVITRFFGPKASKWVSYPAAAIGGFVLAVCSCTILPSVCWNMETGWRIRTSNYLSVCWSGSQHSSDCLYRCRDWDRYRHCPGRAFDPFWDRDRVNHGVSLPTRAGVVDENMFSGRASVKPATWIFFGLMVLALIAGTLQIDLLTNTISPSL